MKKVVLAYSGGLDTSVAVAWLREQYDCEVVTPDGRRRRRLAPRGRREAGDVAPARRGPTSSTRASGSSRDFVWPHLQANALYQGAYPLATALARPLIAQLLVEVAPREGADAVAHGCTGKGNDQVRFDVAVHALDPGLEVVAPMRVGMGLTRDQEIDYAIERGIEIPITKASPYSIDVNLWGRSCETGVLEDPWVTPPADAYEWTVAPSDAPAPVEIVDRVRGRHPGRDRRRAARAGRARRAAPRARRRRTASAGSTTSRTASSGSRAARSTRRRRRRSSTPRIGALEGLTLSKDTLRFDRLVAERARPADLRRAVVQRPPPRPARLRGVVPAGRVAARSGSGSTTARRSSSGGARRCRCTTRTSRPTTRATRSTTPPRSGSSRSSACRCGSRRPATARSGRATARPGPGPIRSSTTCRRRSPTRSRSPRAEAAAPLPGAPATGGASIHHFWQRSRAHVRRTALQIQVVVDMAWARGGRCAHGETRFLCRDLAP